MSAQESADAHAGSVAALADLHGEIDRLTLEAYGWPEGEGEQAMLGRLLALNAERTREEARGEVRWLRPAYQRGRFGRGQTVGATVAGDLLQAASGPAGREPLPKTATGRGLMLKGLLAEARRPLRTQELASRFKGRGTAAEVERTLAALYTDGQLRRGADGGWALVRGG
jgi:hypothetical protein